MSTSTRVPPYFPLSTKPCEEVSTAFFSAFTEASTYSTGLVRLISSIRQVLLVSLYSHIKTLSS